MENTDITEFTDSTREEIKSQLGVLQKHSGKAANDILPRPERYILPRIIKRMYRHVRERLYATREITTENTPHT